MPPPRCQTIDEVIERMEELARTFSPEPGPEFGVYCFNRLYMAVTHGIKQAVEQPGFFTDPELIAQLDVIFAQLYFDAVDSYQDGGEPSDAWRVLFRVAQDRDILPLQFAVAGMNAHINHDLPLALIEQWTTRDHRPGTQDAAYADYTKVNQILKSEEAKERAMVEPRLLDDVDDVDHGAVGRLDGRMAMWVVDQARAEAWRTADHLWDLRHVAIAQKAVLAAVDRVVAMWGDAFLLPL